VTKSRGEAVIREIGQEQHVPYAIIRPAMIYGPRSGMWTKTLFQVAKRRPTPFLGDGSGHAHPIHVDDVVDMMIVLATHPQAENQAFNCAPDPAPTWRALLGGYSQLVGHDRWLALPAWPIRLVAPLAETVMMLRGEPQEVPALIPFVMSHKTYTMTKAREMLGWQPQVSLEDGIQRCAPWLREKGLLS
ncbi:MAG: NAD(P)-dependent oxidoreductase, partial [Anaerolineae bacterium]|nr:NAD(P)-dependent oxidoreductase [Anaerolineae bacterium]